MSLINTIYRMEYIFTLRDLLDNIVLSIARKTFGEEDTGTNIFLPSRL